MTPNSMFPGMTCRAAALSRSIRAARVNLLAEHTGLDAQAVDRLGAVDGLVDYLNGLADSGKTRLRHHPVRSAFGRASLAADAFSQRLALRRGNRS